MNIEALPTKLEVAPGSLPDATLQVAASSAIQPELDFVPETAQSNHPLTKRFFAAGAVLGLSIGLAACGSKASADTVPTTSPTPAASAPASPNAPTSSSNTTSTATPEASTKPSAETMSEAARKTINFHKTLTKDPFNLLLREERLAVVWDRYSAMYSNGDYAQMLGYTDSNGSEILMFDGKGLYDENPADPANTPSATDGAAKILTQIVYAQAFANACATDKDASPRVSTPLDTTCFYQLLAGEVYNVGDKDTTGTGYYNKRAAFPKSVNNFAAVIPMFTDFKPISVSPAEGVRAKNDTDPEGNSVLTKTLTYTDGEHTIIRDVALVPFKYGDKTEQLWVTLRIHTGINK
ncbi:MAG: hypothetical protein WAQ24_05750 [Candidatus Saccharimonadales bacterium]